MRTHCRRGHELAGDNLYLWRNRKAHCKACHRIAAARYRTSHCEQRRRYIREWYWRNREKRRAYLRAYYLKHKVLKGKRHA